ncbi:MAG: hypothetical protein Tsb005_16620 [Gammaproteobacteria bacterium]
MKLAISINYSIVWLLCILGAKQQQLMPYIDSAVIINCIQLIILLKKDAEPRLLIITLGSLLLIGLVIDLTATHLNLITFNMQNSAFDIPLWLIMIWFNFAMFCHVCLRDFYDRWLLMSIIGGIGFMSAYNVGARLGAASIHQPLLCAIYYGLIWGILLPTLFLGFRYIRARWYLRSLRSHR